MISITRLNDVSVVLNSDLIETIESTPDTVVRLTNGQVLVVRESPEEIVTRIREFRNSVLNRFDPSAKSEKHAGQAGN